MPDTLLQKLDEAELDERIREAHELLQPCRVCPRKCGAKRLDGERGFCGAGRELEISSCGPHFGEESVLVGACGSGTIFLIGCSLRCVFCQNYDISHLGRGYEVSAEQLAGAMMELQTRGCHNINSVTPTHFTPQILEALKAAKRQGLSVPLVYNCGGYESVETLKLLDGVIDIYMPDAKYADSKVAERLSGAPDYPEVMKAALKEMHRQVGDLVVENGIAVKGMLIRHLVLPNGLAGTEEVMRFISSELSRDSYVNVMAQYRPTFKAGEFSEINRRPTTQEYLDAVASALKLGIRPC